MTTATSMDLTGTDTGDTGFGTAPLEILVWLAIEVLLAAITAHGYVALALACHFGLVAAYWFLLARKPVELWRCRQIRLLLALSILALGPFGAAGTLVTYLRVWTRQRRATPFEEWYRMLFPEAEISRSDALHRLLVRGGSTVTGNVSPFRDIMADRNETRKRTVLSLIVDYFVPEYAPALQRGLVDSDPTIRVSAATAMAAIEGKYLARGMALETFVSRHPADINAKYALATHLDDYAFTGLLDPTRVVENRQRALSLYQDYATTHNDPESWNRIGRLMVRLGRMNEAAEIYGRLLETYPDYIPALTWSMEYAYGQGRFDTVRELAQRTAHLVESGAPLPPEIRDAIKAWEGTSS